MNVNKTILKLLKQVLGLKKNNAQKKRHKDLDFLVGSWKNEDFLEFEKTQLDFSKPDKEIRS